MTEHERRWASYAATYRKLAKDRNRQYFTNMSVFIERLQALPEFEQLKPCTSHFWLLVMKHEGYQPELPFISVHCNPDGSFTLQLFRSVAEPAGPEITRPLDDAVETLSQLATTF